MPQPLCLVWKPQKADAFKNKILFRKRLYLEKKKVKVQMKRRMKKRKTGKVRTERGGGSTLNFQSDIFPVHPCEEHLNHLLLFGNSKTILGLLNSERKKDILHRCQFQEFCRKSKRAFRQNAEAARN